MSLAGSQPALLLQRAGGELVDPDLMTALSALFTWAQDSALNLFSHVTLLWPGGVEQHCVCIPLSGNVWISSSTGTGTQSMDTLRYFISMLCIQFEDKLFAIPIVNPEMFSTQKNCQIITFSCWTICIISNK